jgi:uncharacterized protein YaiI (UPF0178 family)
VIYVDADACPVKAEVEEVATRLKVPVRMVSNGGIRPSANPLVEMVYVAAGPDEADKWIAERAGPGDVVVTGDVPLAAKCVAAGARVLRHDGEALTERNIGAGARHAGPHGGPARGRSVPAGRRAGVLESRPLAVPRRARPGGAGGVAKRIDRRPAGRRRRP